MSRLKAAIAVRLADPDAERARRNHDERITELQGLPVTELRLLGEVRLADGVATPIAHGLGRVPALVLVSPPRGASSSGRIEEVRGGVDRKQVVVLKAVDWGATVAVDVAVL